MSTDQLSLYNGALRIIGERKLASLSENREPRRVLDDIWANGAVNYCLEQGLWTFAIRSSKITYDSSIIPPFGYQYAFGKPTDYIETAGVCSDEFFESPLTQYSDEANFWFANLQTLYVQYVSSDANFGGNLNGWTQTFTNLVQAYLASEAAARLTQSKDKIDDIDKKFKKAKSDALSKDARKLPAKFLPRGTWARSRSGTRGLFYDRAEQE